MGRFTIKKNFYDPLHTTEATVLVRVTDPSGKTVQQTERKPSDLTGDINMADYTIKSPQLWSTEKPQLYTVEVTVTTKDGVFSQAEKVGFRHFSFITKGRFLNGKRLLIRGTQRHEDAAGVAAALTEDMIRKEMILMKEMGVNFIRLGHYSRDFPAADLGWNVVLNKGKNAERVVAKRGKVQVEESISFQYQTEKWGRPSKLLIEKINEANGVATIEAKLLDDSNVQCLDAVNWIRFGLT